MLVQEKLRNGDFSPSERVIVKYLLEKKGELQLMTVKQIAQATFTSPSLLIRVAHKAGFQGWKELKEALIREEEYLSTTGSIDANRPFQKYDSPLAIANKIATLEREAIEETRKLLDLRHLETAIQILEKAEDITLFGFGNNLLLARIFQSRMFSIGKRAEIDSPIPLAAFYTQPDACGLFISYTGETRPLVDAAKLLHQKKIPIILLTNIEENTLSQYASCVLRICTRENVNSKISTYSTDVSFLYLLDVLYSCIFKQEYCENLKARIYANRMMDLGREPRDASPTEGEQKPV